MHERTHDGRAFRLLTLLDEYTLKCLVIEVQRQMNHQDVLDRLAELFVDRGVPEYIRSDNVLTAKSRRNSRQTSALVRSTPFGYGWGVRKEGCRFKGCASPSDP